MIYLLHGEDIDKARAKAQDLIMSLQKKKPDSAFFKLDAESFDSEKIREYTFSQGIFEKKYIVFLDRVCEVKDLRDSFLDCISDMALSENIFIVLEGKLDKATLGKIEKKADKVQNFDIKEGALGAGSRFPNKSEEYNIFVLADALGKRDRKQAWTLYTNAITNGKSPEEIHGTLFWQVKSMILAEKAKVVGESGLAPFVYAKSKNYCRNYSLDELKNLSTKLVDIYHESRRGNRELEIAIEELVLTI